MTTEERLDRLEQTMFTMAQILNGGSDPRLTPSEVGAERQAARRIVVDFCTQIRGPLG